MSVTDVRTGVVAEGGGLLSDVVACGQDRDAIAITGWPTANTTRERVREAIAAGNVKTRRARRAVWRALVLREPPSIDAGEIADKGYTNQRATIERRAAESRASTPRGPTKTSSHSIEGVELC